MYFRSYFQSQIFMKQIINFKKQIKGNFYDLPLFVFQILEQI